MRRILFVLAASLLVSGAQAGDMPPADPLFAATLTGLDGKPVALAAFRGKPLVVNFWARWCGPCREEIPELVRLRAEQKAKGLEVVGIALEDRAEPVRDYAKAYEIDYPVLLAKDQGIPLMQALGNTKAGLPFTLVVDRQGKVVAKKLGAMKRPELEAAAAAAQTR